MARFILFQKLFQGSSYFSNRSLRKNILILCWWKDQNWSEPLLNMNFMHSIVKRRMLKVQYWLKILNFISFKLAYDFSRTPIKSYNNDKFFNFVPKVISSGSHLFSFRSETISEFEGRNHEQNRILEFNTSMRFT